MSEEDISKKDVWLLVIYFIFVLFFFGVVFLVFDYDNAKKDEGVFFKGKNQKKEQRLNKLNKLLEKSDFEGANKWLISEYNLGMADNGFNCERDYLQPALMVLKTEASYLMDKKDIEAERFFMICANNIASNIGNQSVQIGTFESSEDANVEIAKEYINEVTPYNMTLYSLLCEALIRDNVELAKKLLSLMEKNYKVEEIKTKKGDSKYKVIEDKQTYNEALDEIKKYEASH